MEQVAKKDNDQMAIEDRLDKILIKIKEKGRESLSKEEIKFLDEYSNRNQ